MDLQFYGANCIALTTKTNRFVVDDNLGDLGKQGILKTDDIALFTSPSYSNKVKTKLVIDTPGEYEIGNSSIIGIAAQAHVDEPGNNNSIIYKIITNDLSIVFMGHVYPELNDEQLENIGMVDVLFIPVGGHGYTLDSVGAGKLIRAIGPKLVIPTHYADKSVKYSVEQDSLEAVLKNMSLEPKETTNKLKLKPGDLSENLQLVILEAS